MDIGAESADDDPLGMETLGMAMERPRVRPPGHYIDLHPPIHPPTVSTYSPTCNIYIHYITYLPSCMRTYPLANSYLPACLPAPGPLPTDLGHVWDKNPFNASTAWGIYCVY
jgi:hypothetical protein